MKYWKELLFGNRGGGEPERIETVTPPPVTPPDPEEVARQQASAYNIVMQNLQQQFPQTFGLGEQRAGMISQQLGQPEFMTPEQQAAQEAIRGRETSRLQEAMRTRANLGGGLYGGRAAGTEERAVSQLGQAYAQQDIANRQQRMMGLLGLGGGIDPSAIGQMAPGAGTIYGGQMQAAMAQQPQYFQFEAQKSPWKFGWSQEEGAQVGYGG